MEESVFLESTVTNLRPKVLEFLHIIIGKVKDTKDQVVSFRKKDIAQEVGKDVRTITRYLGNLENNNVIYIKGKRGRSGGTVVALNTDKIWFNTSDQALVNNNEDVDLDLVVEDKFPKQKKEKPNKRKRRTKQEMVEDQIIHNEEKKKNDYLNKQVQSTSGVPTWDLFKETDTPVRNYKVYLLTRLYNRYAKLFTDYNNAEVEVTGQPEDRMVKEVSRSYDILPKEFFGSTQWKHFVKFMDFCNENNIDPAVYLSAQFNRTLFMKSKVGKGKLLPFVNSLISDSSYQVYKEYCQFQKRNSRVYKSSYRIPAQFTDDFLVLGIREAYDTAEEGSGIWQNRASIKDFLRQESLDETENALATFYDIIKTDVRLQGVSYKSRDILKKFVMLQSLTLTGGVRNLYQSTILGLETTRIMLNSIKHPSMSKNEVNEKQAYALGKLLYPDETVDNQIDTGMDLLVKFIQTSDSPFVLRLIMQRKGLYFSLQDLRTAFGEYGYNKIPVDDLSVLDVAQVEDFVRNNVSRSNEQEEDVDFESITQKRGYSLEGHVGNDPFLEDPIKYLYGDNNLDNINI